MTLPVDIDDIRAAARRLDGIARRTPLFADPRLDELAGGRVLIKPECLQLTGSFKIRGASNRLLQLSAQERTAGVVAFSSGNHAQGVAAAAARLSIPALIVMPADAPRLKRENTRALGAELYLYDRHAESREEIAKRIAGERGAVLVPSYDDPAIIAGQGTVGLEIAEQAREQGLVPDLVMAPVGGGGLLSGTALAMREAFPGIEILGVEPRGFDDTARSLASGKREAVAPGADSICDALLAPAPGELTLAILSALGARGLAVGDDEVALAMRFAFERLKLVVEPGGAVALAALLASHVRLGGQTAAIVLSGGNVDCESFCRLAADPSP